MEIYFPRPHISHSPLGEGLPVSLPLILPELASPDFSGSPLDSVPVIVAYL